MLPLTITPLYAALLGLIYFILSFRIPRLRMKHQVGLGESTIPALQRAVRVHGNFAEYVPFCLLLIAFVEGGGYSAWFVHLLGLTLLVARLLHAHGLSRSSEYSPGRFMGTLLTLSVLSISSLLVLIHTLGGYLK